PQIKATLTESDDAGAAILTWAVKGAAMFIDEGLGRVEAVNKATAEYRAEMDPLADFLNGACVLEPGAWISAQDLRAAYEAWCRENGVKYPLTGGKFGERLRNRGCKPKSQKRNTVRGWLGIRLFKASDGDPEGSGTARGHEDG